AFVAIVPPTVAESRAARSTPYDHPAASAARWTEPTVVPADATTVPPSPSTDSIAVRWRRLSTTAPSRGMPPPTRPVFPPWGTMGTPAARHARTISATCSGPAGRTTAVVSPR